MTNATSANNESWVEWFDKLAFVLMHDYKNADVIENSLVNLRIVCAHYAALCKAESEGKISEELSNYIFEAANAELARPRPTSFEELIKANEQPTA